MRDAAPMKKQGRIRTWLSWLFCALIRDGRRTKTQPLLSDQAGNTAHAGDFHGPASMAVDPSGTPRGDGLRSSLHHQMAKCGLAGHCGSDESLDPIPTAVPVCGLSTQVTAPPDMALCRVAEAPEGIPIPPGRYEMVRHRMGGGIYCVPHRVEESPASPDYR